MITDAINIEGKTVFDYPSWAARLSENSSPPGLESELSYDLIPVRVLQSAGGQELDAAEYQGRLSAELINRTQPADFTKMMDVLLPDADQVRVHLGDLVTEQEKCNADGEELNTESHLRPYHFGSPLQGERWHSPLNNSDQIINKDIEFNPNIDGQTLGNMSNLTHDNGQNLWIHPEATLTSNAESYSGQTAAKWTLRDAIKAVCSECNAESGNDEGVAYVLSNPSGNDLDVLDDAPALEAVSLMRGQYLPTYLDQLLHPLGYNWFVDYATGGNFDPTNKWGKSKPKLAIYKKGVGDEKQLYFQAPGEEYDAAHTNLNAYSVSRTIGDMHNAVQVVGDYERREVTLDLYPAWTEAQDGFTAIELARKDGEQYAANKTAYRLWLANEAGDINGLRTDSRAAGPPPNWASFTTYVPHRRIIDPPLTYVGEPGDKTRRDVLLEVSPGGTVSAYREYTGTFAVLPDQIGVMLTDNELPDDVMEDTVIFRITGTVAGDYRIAGKAERDEYAVNGRDVWLELDRPQNYVDRKVDASSVLAGDAAGADERDDTAAIQTYAEKLRDESGHAEVDCQFTLPGFHLHYNIGDLLTNIDGREISLDQTSSDSEASVYVQITKREFIQNVDSGPMTILTVDRGVRIVEDKPEKVLDSLLSR